MLSHTERTTIFLKEMKPFFDPKNTSLESCGSDRSQQLTRQYNRGRVRARSDSFETESKMESLSKELKNMGAMASTIEMLLEKSLKRK